MRKKEKGQGVIVSIGGRVLIIEHGSHSTPAIKKETPETIESQRRAA